jgi:hypothetical protein
MLSAPAPEATPGAVQVAVYERVAVTVSGNEKVFRDMAGADSYAAAVQWARDSGGGTVTTWLVIESHEMGVTTLISRDYKGSITI